MIDWTRYRLKQWGMWCRGGVSLGLPTMTAFARANTGGRAVYDGISMPVHIQEVEDAVNSLPVQDKQVLNWVYCRAGSLRYKAACRGVSLQQLRTLLKHAETATMEALDKKKLTA